MTDILMNYKKINSCPICKSPKIHYICNGFGDNPKLHCLLGLNFIPSSWYECHICGHMFLNPIFHENIERNLYGGEGLYRVYSRSGMDELTYLKSIDPNIPTIVTTEGSRRDFFNHARAFLSSSMPEISVLDFGAGFGASLAFIINSNIEYLGVEIDKYCLDLAEKFSRRVVHPNQIPIDKKFDIIFSWQVFEHIKNPNDGIIQTLRYLKPGGIIAINVPTHSFSLSKNLSLAGLRCLNWGHYHSFSLSSLSTLFNLHNIEVLHSYLMGGDIFVIGRYASMDAYNITRMSTGKYKGFISKLKISLLVCIGTLVEPFWLLRRSLGNVRVLRTVYAKIKKSI